MSALAATCLTAAVLSSPDDLAGLAGLLLALNLFSASQDVATDSLAVLNYDNSSTNGRKLTITYQEIILPTKI